MCKGAACVCKGYLNAAKSWRECVRPVLCLLSPSGATVRDAPVQPGGGRVGATSFVSKRLNVSIDVHR